MGIKEWRKGTKRICSQCRKIFYCNPSKSCLSVKKSICECRCHTHRLNKDMGSCDISWRKNTNYLIGEDAEMVNFT